MIIKLFDYIVKIIIPLKVSICVEEQWRSDQTTNTTQITTQQPQTNYMEPLLPFVGITRSLNKDLQTTKFCLENEHSDSAEVVLI